VKTIKQIYGYYANRELVNKMEDLADHAQTILRLRRNEIISREDGLHNPVLNDVVKALDFWEEIKNQCREYRG